MATGSSLASPTHCGYGCVYFFLFKAQESSPAHNCGFQPSNIITTKNGSRTKIELPDGSIAWLNAGSKLTYDKQFGNLMREVELSGEAYFDVKHDEHKTFHHSHSIYSDQRSGYAIQCEMLS